MKKYTVVVMFLFASMASAQDKLIDRLFMQGIELANLGQTRAALALSVRCDSIETARPDASTDYYCRGKDWQATIYAELGEYEKALIAESCAVERIRSLLGEDDLLYAIYIGRLAFYRLNYGYPKKAASETSTALAIIEKRYGQDSPLYLNMLRQLALCQLYAFDFKSASLNWQFCYRKFKQTVLKSFAHLGSAERAAFWKQYAYGFESFTPMLCQRVKNRLVVDMALDATLFSKGLLLNADMSMQRSLLESPDEDIRAKCHQLQAIRADLDRQYDMPISQRSPDCDIMEKEAKQLEDELVSRSMEYGDYTLQLKIGWREVQQHLGKKDLAVEFVRYRSEGHTFYAAFTLHRGDVSPRMISLFEENELKQIAPEDYYTTDALTNLIWRKIVNQLDGMKRVYFAPVGELYKIGIENVPGVEQYKMYRLSSVRELARSRDAKQGGDAVLFGGIKYELDSEERLEATGHSGKRQFRDTPNLRKLRGAVIEIPYLDGSEQEVVAIEAVMKRQHVPVTLRMGTGGTEEAFKSLAGQKVATLHLSTHGFYEKRDTSLLNRELSGLRMSATTGSGPTEEDLSLSRSGLLLAGASGGLYESQETLSGAEDGILTAREISRLDLQGLQMVVLSACETALGDVSGEGVFGLQRGFKKAGAQSILMSLWKVDDEATCLLMTEFYKNWIGKKMAKHDALQQAKQTVRAHKENGWDDPKYWAAFVLLDGLD